MIDEKRKIFKNISHLSILQIGNYIIPFLLIPYLVKVLGLQYFGLVSFLQAVMINLTVVTDYGFNISTISQVSVNRHDKPFLIKLYSEVFFTKLLLFVPCLVILAILIFFVPKCYQHPYATLGSFLIVIGNSLIPLWLFQGMEQMKFTTIFTLTGKIIFAVLTLVLVHGPNDFFLVMALQGLGGIVASIAAMYFISKRWGISINVKGGINGVKKQLQDGWHFFVSNLSIIAFMNMNIIILGLFASDKIVGLYSVAEKIMQTIRVLLTVYTQAIYAHICLLMNRSRHEVVLFLKKMFIPFLIGIVCLCTIVFIMAPFIAAVLVKENAHQLVIYIRLIIFVPAIVCANIPFNLIILAKNLKNLYVRILLFVAIEYLVTSIIATYYFGAIGTCIALVLAEAIDTFLLYRTAFDKYLSIAS